MYIYPINFIVLSVLILLYFSIIIVKLQDSKIITLQNFLGSMKWFLAFTYMYVLILNTSEERGWGIVRWVAERLDDFIDFFSDFSYAYWARVTNASFYDSKIRSKMLKKRRIKELRSATRFKNRGKSFHARLVFLVCRRKSTVAPLISARDSIFVQLTRGMIARCFLLRWWASAITPAIVEKHVWLESAHPDFFFSLLLDGLYGRVLHVVLVYARSVSKRSWIFF